MEKAAGAAFGGAVGGLREPDRQGGAGEDAEISLAGGVAPVVGAVEDFEIVAVAEGFDGAYPCCVVAAAGAAFGHEGRAVGAGFLVVCEGAMGVFCAGNFWHKGAPGHEFGDVFDVDVVGLDGVDVAEYGFGQGAGLGVAGVAAFGAGIVGAFGGHPDDDAGTGVEVFGFADGFGDGFYVGEPDVFFEVECVGVVGLVALYGDGAVVDGGGDVGYLPAVLVGGLAESFGDATGAAKQVDGDDADIGFGCSHCVKRF